MLPPAVPFPPGLPELPLVPAVPVFVIVDARLTAEHVNELAAAMRIIPIK
jgi:hypothetical protein